MMPGEAQPIDLINDTLILRATTRLTMGPNDLHDAQILAKASRISQCLGAL